MSRFTIRYRYYWGWMVIYPAQPNGNRKIYPSGFRTLPDAMRCVLRILERER